MPRFGIRCQPAIGMQMFLVVEVILMLVVRPWGEGAPQIKKEPEPKVHRFKSRSRVILNTAIVDRDLGETVCENLS